MPLKKSAGPVVGLDIGSSLIKACEIDCRGGRAHLRGIAVMPTPPEAVVNNEITDPVALGKTIKLLFKQAGIKASQVVTSVSGQTSLVVRIIEVPKMTRAELQETMKWEIERHVPFAAEQTVMDFQPLVAPELVPEGQNIEVLLAVAQEALVNRQVETLQAAGLKALAIDIEPLAQSRALIDLSNGAAPAGTLAVIDIGATTTDVNIYRDGRIAFTRSIQLAGNNLTKAIADVLGRPLADAEQLKKDLAGIPESQSQAPGPDPGFDDQFAPLTDLNFGEPAPDLMGGSLGGSFGAAPVAAEATVTGTHVAQEVDIAGGGFSTDAFTSPSPDPAASPFDAAATAAPNPFETPATASSSLAGPVPQGNAFDPGIFGDAPATDPFGAANDPFGMGAAPMAGMGSPMAPAAMSEEDYLKTQISDAIMPILSELVTELRRSLDFYRNRANGLGAQQVIVSGGTAKLPGITGFLSANLEVPVVIGNPLQFLAVGPKTDANYLQDVGPIFPVSVGLAMRELMLDVAPVLPKAPKAPKAPKPPKAAKSK